jgi:hypothetical protein
MPRGRTAEQLAEIRGRREPLSDARRGRLFRQIELAFIVSKGKPLTTAEVMDYCYPAQRLSIMGGIKSWHRTNTIRGLRRVATPIGRRSGKGAGKGRPMMWTMDAHRMERRSFVGRLKRAGRLPADRKLRE